MNKRKHVIVVGAGFGGLKTVQTLKKHDLDVTLIDRTNHHLFQPLLYQVAVSALAPGDIAVPVRTIFNRDKNVTVLMGEVIKIDRNEKKIVLENNQEISFDYLVLAPGARHSYFGNDEWENRAPGLKTLSDALDIRESILLSFEKAERAGDPEVRRIHETFVVAGGGPTGVEMAGAITEIASKAIRDDYRRADLRLLKVILVEGQSRLLGTYPPALSERARKDLEKMGVTVYLNTMVTDISRDGVTIMQKQAGQSNPKKSFIPTRNIIWAAGNAASPLLETLDLPLEKDGRLRVEPDLSVAGHPSIFVIGDAALHMDERGFATPAIAPGAIQQGEHAAKSILSDINGSNRKAFAYFDKGSMATIGRAKAVAQIGRFGFGGFMAWLLWSVIHVIYLIRFRNRFRVMAEWIWYYISFRGSSTLITRKSMSDHAPKGLHRNKTHGPSDTASYRQLTGK